MSLLSKFVNDLDRNIQTDCSQRNISLGAGGAADYARYKELCGINAGMARAVNMAREMLRQVELSEDEDLPPMPKPRRKKAS